MLRPCLRPAAAAVLAAALAGCTRTADVPGALAELDGDVRVLAVDDADAEASCLERVQAGEGVSPVASATGDGVVSVTFTDEVGDLHACDGLVGGGGIEWCGFSFAPTDGLDGLEERGGGASFTCQHERVTEVFGWVVAPDGAAWVAVPDDAGWRAFPAHATVPTRIAVRAPIGPQPVVATVRFLASDGRRLAEREVAFYAAG